jgi:hypothetical protein
MRSDPTPTVRHPDAERTGRPEVNDHLPVVNSVGWELDELLRELVRRRWTLYYFGNRERPDLLTAISQREYFADVSSSADTIERPLTARRSYQASTR